MNKTDIIKLSITRLFMLTGTWSLFFLLYYSSDFPEVTPNLPPIVIGFLSLYAIGEIVLTICALRNEK